MHYMLRGTRRQTLTCPKTPKYTSHFVRTQLFQGTLCPLPPEGLKSTAKHPAVYCAARHSAVQCAARHSAVYCVPDTQPFSSPPDTQLFSAPPDTQTFTAQPNTQPFTVTQTPSRLVYHQTLSRLVCRQTPSLYCAPDTLPFTMHLVRFLQIQHCCGTKLFCECRKLFVNECKFSIVFLIGKSVYHLCCSPFLSTFKHSLDI